MNSIRKPVAVVVGATSKWQSDGRNTKLVHGKALDDSEMPVGARWGVGGAIAQKFAKEGFSVVLTTRTAANASALEKAIREQDGESMIVELDLVSRESISKAFAQIREQVGDPDVLVYNAGYLEGRDLPPEKGIARKPPGRNLRNRAAHCQPWTVLGRPRGVARHARARRRLFLDFQQRVVPARTKTNDRRVAVLPESVDAHPGAGADGGILRAWRACSQRRDRRPHRFSRHPGLAPRPATTGRDNESRQDC